MPCPLPMQTRDYGIMIYKVTMVDSVKLRTSPYNIHHKLTADQEVNSSMGIGQGERLLGKDLAHRATDRTL